MKLLRDIKQKYSSVFSEIGVSYDFEGLIKSTEDLILLLEEDIDPRIKLSRVRDFKNFLESFHRY